MESKKKMKQKWKSKNRDKNGPPIKKKKLNNQTNPSNIQSQRVSLPIFGAKKRFLKEIKPRETAIIIGETGSGKTTQIPQFIFEAGLHGDGTIAVTQPRRVAAISIAQRVALEMGTKIGNQVGYSVRFEDVSSVNTKIKFMTDGTLLREALSDDLLMSYNVIILDEAHERTVHTDVLFGIVKKVQKLRKEKGLALLRIMIMSATIDIDRFKEYFNCDALYIEGRPFNVSVYHLLNEQKEYLQPAILTLFKIHREAPPNEDVLIFLTGQDQIESAASKIRSISKHSIFADIPLHVCPLYAGLPFYLQQEALKKSIRGHRKVILSTNVAETSLTIPGVKFVIDTGVVKVRTFQPSTGLEILRVQTISKAQANQRTGRAGRESDGVCYRMFTKKQFQSFGAMPVPAILNCNIVDVTLQLLALKIDVSTFDFMQKPSHELIQSALDTLLQLKAIKPAKKTGEINKKLRLFDNRWRLTAIGKKMSKFPVLPNYSRIILAAIEYRCVQEILTIIAILSSERIFYEPPLIKAKEQQKIVAAREKYRSQLSDLQTYVLVFRDFLKAKNPREWCHDNFLHWRNLVYAKKVRDQLMDICGRVDIDVGEERQMEDQGDMVDVIKCMLSGLFMNVAQWCDEKRTFLTLDSKQPVTIHPKSMINNRSCTNTLMFTETTNSCMKNVSIIELDWLADVAPDYCKSHGLIKTKLSLS